MYVLVTFTHHLVYQLGLLLAESSSVVFSLSLVKTSGACDATRSPCASVPALLSSPAECGLCVCCLPVIRWLLQLQSSRPELGKIKGHTLRRMCLSATEGDSLHRLQLYHHWLDWNKWSPLLARELRRLVIFIEHISALSTVGFCKRKLKDSVYPLPLKIFRPAFVISSVSQLAIKPQENANRASLKKGN